jgi:predicted nucleotidyltransferase
MVDPNAIMPTKADVSKIYTAKINYERAQKTAEKDSWNKSHFKETPWGIAYLCSKAKHEKTIASAKAKGWDKHGGYSEPKPKDELALKCYIIAVMLGWQELVVQLKRTLKNWGYTKENMQEISKTVWLLPENAKNISETIAKCIADTPKIEEQLTCISTNILLSEAVEKHKTLNLKLFTKDELLKDRVRDKLLEVVDEFKANLKEQDIELKINDIILIGSNASYNYTKNSDIDLHILVDTSKTKYTQEIAASIYGAYRTLFNKQLDIKLFDIPVEIFVETEDNKRVSNGVYSVKKNKWIKKPVHEDIPDYDKAKLKTLVDKWEAKCKDVLDEVKADKLNDEKKVVKLLTDIYEKLRKKGVSKGEYSEENLAFKELRNDGYLDDLKQSKNDLISKRLSLEERFDRQTRTNQWRRDVVMKLERAAGTQPIVQDNGTFYIYNIKESDIDSRLQAIKRLSFVSEVYSSDSGKYDFSDVVRMATHNLPAKYYNIRGKIKDMYI